MDTTATMQGSRKTKGKREMAPAEEQQQPSPKGQAWYALLLVSSAADSLLPVIISDVLRFVVFVARFCTTGLPSDVVIEVGDMTFHLHKVSQTFPHLSAQTVPACASVLSFSLFASQSCPSLFIELWSRA
jgi:hypothetical protein